MLRTWSAIVLLLLASGDAPATPVLRAEAPAQEAAPVAAAATA